MRVASHAAHSAAAIFLPFPKRNVISAQIKTKAQTNLFWGNLQLFTCQAELLKMPGWSDSSWHSLRQTNYRGTLQLEKEQQTSAKHSNPNPVTVWVMCITRSIVASITDSTEINVASHQRAEMVIARNQMEEKTFMSECESLCDSDDILLLKERRGFSVCWQNESPLLIRNPTLTQETEFHLLNVSWRIRVISIPRKTQSPLFKILVFSIWQQEKTLNLLVRAP